MNIAHTSSVRSASRRIRRALRLVPAIVLIGVVGIVPSNAATHKKADAEPAPDSAWHNELEQWRTARASELSAPDGWMTLVGLEWLKPGKNTIGLAADSQVRLKGHAPEYLAVIEVNGSQLRLAAPAGGFPPHLLVDGQPAHEGPLQPDDEKASVISDENLTLVVLHRGDRFALRIKDAQSPTRTSFRGLHWYAPDARYRVTAKWIPFNPPHTEKIPTIIGTTLDMPAPGLAEFTLDGKTIQLEPVLEEPNAKEFFFILRDATSHTTTYEAARFLYTSLPDHGMDQPGTVVLDFNRLQNPPCAYTPYATCPLPPYVNRLAISIPAGEQRYAH
ncbi:DUF1684 domain-containing protein [Acidicapsa ligni]|uniref:DUF1684 domain-containing protein n=1 Tax=Acidicapsa ligni TaxID=542300 RepID=UPI0021DFB68D|nr:DUF1684 domain-containing protein [Acidicapsa ligni]